MQNGVALVQGDKIVDAGSNLPISSAARVIDLGDATLYLGLWDAHTHLIHLEQTPRYFYTGKTQRSPTWWGILA